MHYSLFSFVQHSFSMVMNYVNEEPWLPSVGESPSKIFDVTMKLGNITDSQPLSNQEVIKAVTQEFKGKITCSGKWGKLITNWYSTEQATESLILWNMLLIGIHRVIVYYLCKKQPLIPKKNEWLQIPVMKVWGGNALSHFIFVQLLHKMQVIERARGLQISPL